PARSRAASSLAPSWQQAFREKFAEASPVASQDEILVFENGRSQPQGKEDAARFYRERYRDHRPVIDPCHRFAKHHADVDYRDCRQRRTELQARSLQERSEER